MLALFIISAVFIILRIIDYIILFVQNQHHVQPGECAVTGGELKPVQLSVNAYLGNIT